VARSGSPATSNTHQGAATFALASAAKRLWTGFLQMLRGAAEGAFYRGSSSIDRSVSHAQVSLS